MPAKPDPIKSKEAGSGTALDAVAERSRKSSSWEEPTVTKRYRKLPLKFLMGLAAPDLLPVARAVNVDFGVAKLLP